MDIKVGDKVRFLNSVGGGIVRGFKGKDQVMVEGDDGFDIPCLIREVVVVENLDSQKYTRKPQQPAPAEAPKPKPEPEEGEVKIEETPEGERLNVFLAFLPEEPNSMQNSSFEAYFVNESNYYLSFNYMNRQNNSWHSRYNGLIEPNTKIFLEEFPKEELNNLERVCVQFIAFKKDKPFTLKNAISVELRIDTVKFYKIHCFMENDFFEEDALVFPVVRGDMPERELLVSATELQEAMQQKIRTDRQQPTPVHKKKEPNPVIEIDLHIGQLLDNTHGLSNADMLEYQLKKFNEVMQQYAGHKEQKIVFIHGKGEGVLRSAIEKELKQKYKHCPFQDASFREYGFGATMVTIK